MNRFLERAMPVDASETSALLARCNAEGRSVTVVGGGTLDGMLLPPAAGSTILCTTAMDRIVDYQPADLTVAAQAGVTVRSLNAALAAHRQFVPFDAPRAAYATVGGTLASGWLGPRRHLYGRPRDYTIGTTVVLADGTVARAGGMVVKNVAGYDMSRLYVGSFGTLAVIVRANLKTLPAPPRARAFLARLPERTRARACSALAGLAIAPAAALWIDGFHGTIDGDEGPEGRLFVLLQTTDAALERATRDLRSALGRAGVPETRIVDAGAYEAFERILDASIANLGERSISYRIRAGEASIDGLACEALALAHDCGLRAEAIADVMNDDAFLRVSDLDARAMGGKIEAFDEALHALEPCARVVAGEHPIRGDLNVFGAPPAAIAQMHALKNRFDPHAILNPGRFVGGI